MTHWGMGWGMGFGFGWIFLLIIIGLVIWGIKAISGNSGRTDGGGSRNRALEILNERYARGEIDREEYESRKRDIMT